MPESPLHPGFDYGSPVPAAERNGAVLGLANATYVTASDSLARSSAGTTAMGSSRSATDASNDASTDAWARSVDQLEQLSRQLAEGGASVERSVADEPRTAARLAPTSLPSESPESLAASATLPFASIAEQRRWHALQQFGDFTLAYNTAAQEHLEYHWSNLGYLAYVQRKGHVFVLGDPVTSADDIPTLLDSFLARFPRPTFVQVSAATAAHLAARRFYINEMGVDTTLDLPQYSFAGKSMERIRYASNWLKKHGYHITELTYADIDPQAAVDVSQQWRKSMKYSRSEMRFLNRPICYRDERDVRKFFLRDAQGRCLAFMYFDPLYRDGQVIGYATAIKRRHPDAPLYAEQGIMRAAIEQFQKEGKLQVTLGLSPMAWIENKTFPCNPFLHYSFRYAFRAWWVNRYFYNLEGHAQYKRHFKGSEQPYHYASPVLFNDLRIVNLLRLTGVY
jgi:phosphatidylglycerol lysyltransferase